MIDELVDNKYGNKKHVFEFFDDQKITCYNATDDVKKKRKCKSSDSKILKQVNVFHCKSLPKL